MLGQMNFETPNVIDPGDNVPSTPSRSLQKDFENRGGSRVSISSNESDSDRIIFKPGLSRTIKINYQDDADDEPASESLSRVDLDPEHGFENEGLIRPTSNASSPTMEQTRLFAAAMLNESEKRGFKRPTAATGSPVKKLFGAKRYNRDEEYLRNSLGLDYPNPVMDKWRRERRRRLYYIACIILSLVVIFTTFGVMMQKHVDEHDDRTREVYDFLTSNDVSTVDDLAKTGSPQYRAARWIANYDTERVDIPFQDEDPRRFNQRYSLAVLYYALGGDNWATQLNFLASDHECGWNEEIPDENKEVYAVGVSCNSELLVDSLLIPSNNLQGSIPGEVRQLSELKFISLKHNEIAGELPSSLQQLTLLEYLDLKFNQVKGSIPDYIGQLPHLQVLGLSHNKLVGSLPASLSSLRLKTLAVDGNELSGDLSAIRQLNHLKYLYAQDNSFHGNLFHGLLMTQLPSLVEVDLSGNNLTATEIPSHIFTLPDLRLLDASNNQISGKLPDDLPPNNALEYLSFRGNNIASSIPDSISNFGKLTHLDLEQNKLTGTLPVSLVSLTNMEYLFLGKNDYAPQSIPGELKELVNLKELSLDNANLQGEMPAWIEGLSHLILLDLRENQLQGSLDQIDFTKFPVMKYMMLNDNQFSGTISSMAAMEQLEVLSVYHNGLTGDPEPICVGSNDLYWLATDCSNVASCSCCDKCCDGDDCFGDSTWDKLENSKWDHNYSRAEYAFNPNILLGDVYQQPRGGAK
eukprot:CAMPEP_0113653814 /NCGR_PEP_ID=MMETSP0017_2-20120614/28799_1 /TAXON_ID=2856 /ORGANISM="Cylindrotheca closterium" /LENGTH=747 /DNA_ID=CAMNT_0000566871 /DNA_START=47 /DNA_END=2290 /DNA_ORIENTATION=+ /assembly_acc=CAM_ASM_000147